MVLDLATASLEDLALLLHQLGTLPGLPAARRLGLVEAYEQVLVRGSSPRGLCYAHRSYWP